MSRQHQADVYAAALESLLDDMANDHFVIESCCWYHFIVQDRDDDNIYAQVERM